MNVTVRPVRMVVPVMMKSMGTLVLVLIQAMREPTVKQVSP